MQAVNAANAPILPIMLSTMALPEMEAEEKGLLSQLDASMAAMSDQELHAFLGVCHFGHIHSSRHPPSSSLFMKIFARHLVKLHAGHKVIVRFRKSEDLCAATAC